MVTVTIVLRYPLLLLSLDSYRLLYKRKTHEEKQQLVPRVNYSYDLLLLHSRN